MSEFSDDVVEIVGAIPRDFMERITTITNETPLEAVSSALGLYVVAAEEAAKGRVMLSALPDSTKRMIHTVASLQAVLDRQATGGQASGSAGTGDAEGRSGERFATRRAF